MNQEARGFLLLGIPLFSPLSVVEGKQRDRHCNGPDLRNEIGILLIDWPTGLTFGLREEKFSRIMGGKKRLDHRGKD